jgi:hypothetical protein
MADRWEFLLPCCVVIVVGAGLFSGGYRFWKERKAMAERLGDYMIRTGAMNQAQVEEVAKLKAAGDKRHFGDIAISLGFIKAADVEAYLASLK